MTYCLSRHRTESRQLRHDTQCTSYRAPLEFDTSRPVSSRSLPTIVEMACITLYPAVNVCSLEILGCQVCSRGNSGRGPVVFKFQGRHSLNLIVRTIESHYTSFNSPYGFTYTINLKTSHQSILGEIHISYISTYWSSCLVPSTFPSP